MRVLLVLHPKDFIVGAGILLWILAIIALLIAGRRRKA